MSKAVLIMDMPDCCGDCILRDIDSSGLYCIPAENYFDGDDSSEERETLCPLRKLPDRKEEVLKTCTAQEALLFRENRGWNACLDAIEDTDA